MHETIARLTARPEPFASGDAGIWTDPRVAPQMLAAHLDPNTDAASRRPEQIEREVARIAALVPRGGAVLDLGCGPGLYAYRLARRGFAVTGIDLAPLSLAHARERAAEGGLEIRYVEADYRGLDEQEAYDLVLLAYLDFGVLAPAERSDLLARVRAALRPGGAFVFDVVTEAAPRPERRDWEAAPEGGFWRTGPYLVLVRRFDFGELLLSCDEHVVIEPHEATIYRIWEQRFRRPWLEVELAAAGFRVESVWADLAGTPWMRDAETLAVVARR